MMSRVKEGGGLAADVEIGMDSSAELHTERFGVDEDALAVGVEAEAQVALGVGEFLVGL